MGRHGDGRGRPQRAIYCAIVANRKLAHGDPGLGAGPTAHPPTRSTLDPRARERGSVPGRREEGGCGRQSRMSMSGERQAVCARRVGVRRPKGVGWGVAEPHEEGTNTRNDDRKIDC